MDNLTSLRGKIAGAVFRSGGIDIWHSYVAADEVIRELGLAQEYAYTRHPRRRGADYRYVTAWTNDE